MNIDFDFYRKWACQKMIESSQSNKWDGHWACSVIALTELLEEKLVTASVKDLIRKNLAKIVDEHANEQQYQVNKEYEDFTAQMIRQLFQYNHTCHSLSHDVIYTFYILRVLSRSTIPATAELFDAMGKIVRGFVESGPGYVTVNGENILIDPDDIPNLGERLQLTPDTVLDVFHNFIRPLQNGERRHAARAYPYAWSRYCRNETSLSQERTRQPRSSLLRQNQHLNVCKHT